MSGFLSRSSFAKDKSLYFQGLVQNPLAYRWPSAVVSIHCLIPNALAATQAFYNTVIHIISARCSRGSGLEAVTIPENSTVNTLLILDPANAGKISDLLWTKNWTYPCYTQEFLLETEAERG